MQSSKLSPRNPVLSTRLFICNLWKSITIYCGTTHKINPPPFHFVRHRDPKRLMCEVFSPGIVQAPGFHNDSPRIFQSMIMSSVYSLGLIFRRTFNQLPNKFRISLVHHIACIFAITQERNFEWYY